MTIFGVDATSSPSVSSMKAAGVQFICRYLSVSNSETEFKLLTNSEAKTLSQGGIAIVSNYEWTGTPDNTIAAGASDAKVALAQHAACGGPPGRPIYFSIDEDTVWTDVNVYFQGIATVMPVSQIGAYGEAGLIKDLKSNGLITWLWQTYAWSGGVINTNNNIYQYSNNQTIGGTSVDYDYAYGTDYGQWFQVGFTQPAGVSSSGTTTINEDEQMPLGVSVTLPTAATNGTGIDSMPIMPVDEGAVPWGDAWLDIAAELATGKTATFKFRFYNINGALLGTEITVVVQPNALSNIYIPPGSRSMGVTRVSTGAANDDPNYPVKGFFESAYRS